MASRGGKGKSIDRSTEWSAYHWDMRGFWVSSRFDKWGQEEYQYRYPETALQQQTTPRHPLPNVLNDATAYYPSTATSTPNVSETAYSKDSEYETTCHTTAAYVGTVEFDHRREDFQTGLLASVNGTTRSDSEPHYIHSHVASDSPKELNERFQVINQPSRFFRIGRVFKVLWMEPLGNPNRTSESFVTASKSGEKAYSKVRHFVVIREMQGCCLCLPLSTYNRQGVGKPFVRTQDHAAVYPLGGRVQLGPGEQLVKEPFPIIVENSRETIHPMSRLNFGRVYTVEHNVKAMKVGRIPVEKHALLDKYFAEALRIPSSDSVVSESNEVTTQLISRGNSETPKSHFPTDGTELYWSMETPPDLMEATTFPTYPAYQEQSSSIYVPSLSFASTPVSYGSEDILQGFQDMKIVAPSSITESFGLESTSVAKVTGNPLPTSSGFEELDKRYRIIEDRERKRFWRVGRVFMVLWTEPSSVHAGPRGGSHFSDTYLNGRAYSEIRRFVIVAEGYGSSICSPIYTYSGQATLKPNLPERQQHAIIYTGESVPAEYSYVAVNGTVVTEDLIKDPIKVRSEQDGPEGHLDLASRLNYSKIYTVEHYVRVLNIGMVDNNSIASLKRNCLVKPRETPIERPRHLPRRNDRQSDGGKGKSKEKTKIEGKRSKDRE